MSSRAFRSSVISREMSGASAFMLRRWSGRTATCTSIRRRPRTRGRSRTPNSSSSTASAWKAGCRGWCNPPAAKPPSSRLPRASRRANWARAPIRTAGNRWPMQRSMSPIFDALVAADPAGAEVYRGNADMYLAKLDALEREVREAIAQIPPTRRKVISTHDAFGYFASAYGIEFIAPQGVSTEAEVSARDIARIITQIRATKIPAVFLENVSDSRLMRRISNETGARVGGTLYSDSLTDEKGDAPTYIDMVRHNIKALTGALMN